MDKEWVSDLIQGVVVHLALVREDGLEAPAARLDAHSPQLERSLANSMHGLTVSTSSHSMQTTGTHEDCSHQSAGNQQPPHPPPMTLHMQHPFAMWPVLCQPQLQPNLAYVLDSNQPFHQPSPSAMGHYQVAAPMLPRHGQTAPLPEDYSQPRTMPGLGRPDSRRQHAARVSRSSFYSVATHHNHVDVARIREGIDVRTTVSSLIPNSA